MKIFQTPSYDRFCLFEMERKSKDFRGMDGNTAYKNKQIDNVEISNEGRRALREKLREVHPAKLNTLTLTGELWTYLADLNEQAQERLDTIMEQMKAADGVTEELKSTHQMEWVQRCNNIHNRAEEIILQEMIYS